MNYNDLVILVKQKKLSVKEFAEQIGMSRQGLQRSLDMYKLPYDKVVECCKLLGLTPNEFFEWETAAGINGVYASNISGVNTQNSDTAILALRDELREQRAQLKEKDRQIARLLDLLGKTDRMGYSSLAAETPVGYKQQTQSTT